ncbi:Protein T16G12.1 [Aphelenchoides avenae]|nr:Protein T16G12.1 [Aphelenchus avenae]
MSTYLLAFVIGDIASTTATETRDGLTVRAWGWQEMQPYLEYAADTTAKCLTAMEEYTGIKYNLDKIDLVAVPYLAGAMENWGLIISHYDYVFHDPNVI